VLVIPVALLFAGVVAALMIAMLFNAEVGHNQNQAVQATERRLLGAGQALSEHVDSTVAAIDVATLYLRGVWEHDPQGFAAAATEIRRAAIPGLILQLTVLDRQGREVYSSRPGTTRRIPWRDPSPFSLAVNQGSDALFIGQPVLEHDSGQPQIQISRRLLDAQGRFDGAVIVAIRPDDLIRIYDHLGLGREGSVGLVGADRVVRVRMSHITQETHHLSDTLPADRIYFRRGAPAQGVFHTASGGVDQRARFVAYWRMEHYPLIVYVSETDADIAQQSAAHDRLLLLMARGIAGGVLLFFAVIAWMFLRLYRSRAALQAAEQALRLSNQDLAARVSAELAKNREKDHLLIQQSRMAAMGEMVHNIAHQWRQPLNSLGLLISNLHDDVVDGVATPASLDQDVADARRLIEKMSTTIDDFRDFFRPDRETTTFDIAQEVRAALAIVNASMKNNRIELVTDMPEPLFASGYPNQYAQAVLNLVVNAKEALVERAVVNARIVISLSRIESQAVLMVEDNAGGIDAAILAKIFDPYFTTKEQGSGIGLYMVKMIIERAMGGRVEVQSMESGSRFSLSVPWVQR
jgi:signal transduction histidine kinase